MKTHLKENKDQIKSLYLHLEIVRSNMRSLILNNYQYLTSDNLELLEMEEEKVISRLLKLKTLLK